MKTMEKSRLIYVVRSAAFITFGILLVIIALRLFKYHYDLILNPYPLEYREGSQILITDMLLKGQDMYSLASMPLATNVYGPVYNIIVAPFAKIFGVTLAVHRVISAVFIFLSCGLLFVVLHRERVPIIYNLASTLICYSSLLFFVGPLARPDALGVFLFLLSIFLPFLRGYSKSSLIISALAGIVSFYTKQYFAASIFYIATFLFLFQSKRKGFYYGLTTLSLLFLSMFVINVTLKTYFLNSLFNHINLVTDDRDFLNKQILLFVEINLGVILLLGVVSVSQMLTYYKAHLRNQLHSLRDKIDFLHADKPMILLPFSLPLYSLLTSILIFYFVLGPQNGNWMVYTFQFITPFLLVYVFVLSNSAELLSTQLSFPLKSLPASSAQTNLKRLAFLFLIPCVYFTVYRSFYSLPLASPYTTLTEWAHVRQLTEAHKNIFNTPLITHMLVQQNKPVSDSGLSEYFEFSTVPPAFTSAFSVSNAEIKGRWAEYVNSIDKKLQQQDFDLILITAKRYVMPSLLKSVQTYYSLEEAIWVCMPQSEQCIQLEVWKPKVISP